MKSIRLHGTGDLQVHAGPVSVVGEEKKLVCVKYVLHNDFK